MKLALLTIGVALACGATSGFAQDNWQNYLGEVRIKKAIADTLTPAQLEERRERLAKLLAARAADGSNSINTPGDNCAAATFEVSALPFNSAGTTVGMTDSIDLSSTCSALAGACPAGSPLYTGSGTGPDQAFRIQTSADCSLTITMDPATEDLGVFVFFNQCSSSGADCVCMDDAGLAGAPESVVLSAVGGNTYFVVADGYSTGAAPPGPSDAYTLAITGAGCSLLPVELQSFEIN